RIRMRSSIYCIYHRACAGWSNSLVSRLLSISRASVLSSWLDGESLDWRLCLFLPSFAGSGPRLSGRVDVDDWRPPIRSARVIVTHDVEDMSLTEGAGS